jgi:hypothetical protein
MRHFGKIGTGYPKMYLAPWTRESVRAIAADFAENEKMGWGPLQIDEVYLQNMDGSEVLFSLHFSDRYHVYELRIVEEGVTRRFNFNGDFRDIPLVTESRKVVFD